MAQANAQAGAGPGDAQQPGFVPNGPPRAAPAAPARQVADGAVVVAGPVNPPIANPLPHPHPRFDIGAALLMSPVPTQNDIGCYIHPEIN